MSNDFLAAAQKNAPELIKIRRTIHQHPEIGFDLPKTLSLVEGELKSLGYAATRVGRAGICVTAGRPGKTILLRADMDALPMEEKSGLEFASTNGNCHSCGHDIHTTSLLGAARLLKDCEEGLAGTVKLMFQPCEEGLGGMQDMLDNGLLENPAPDVAFALHVINEKTGSVGIRRGYAGASCASFTITLKGVGCHGAAPYLGVDPINAAAHLITALQVLNSREVAADKMLVLTVCTVHGGDAVNIVPDECTISGTIRTADNEVRQFAMTRLREIADSVAITFRARADIIINEGVPPMINEPTLSDAVSAYVDEVLGEGSAWQIPAMTGSEDFALLCDHMPSVLGWFGTGNADEGYPHGNHNSAVVFNEDAIPMMSAVYAHCASRWLEDNS